MLKPIFRLTPNLQFIIDESYRLWSIKPVR